MYVYSCNALSARFFAVDRALNSYFMIMIIIVRIKIEKNVAGWDIGAWNINLWPGTEMFLN